jgi:Ca2+-binding EF-hand superfamily protein
VQAFLLRFRPVNPLLAQSNSSGDLKATESLERLVELLSSNRYELDSLFRHFDTNGDGVISVDEFTEGVVSLTALLKRDFSVNEIRQLVTLMVRTPPPPLPAPASATFAAACQSSAPTVMQDLNKDGVISYDEFFQSFEVVDPALAAKQRAQKQRQGELRPPIPKKSATFLDTAAAPAPAATAAGPAAPASTANAAAGVAKCAAPAPPIKK